jgi:hypothetical protein
MSRSYTSLYEIVPRVASDVISRIDEAAGRKAHRSACRAKAHPRNDHRTACMDHRTDRLPQVVI